MKLLLKLHIGRDFKETSKLVGYSEMDVEGDGNLGLGCGNPRSFAEIKPGETVMDLGFFSFFIADASYYRSSFFFSSCRS